MPYREPAIMETKPKELKFKLPWYKRKPKARCLTSRDEIVRFRYISLWKYRFNHIPYTSKYWVYYTTDDTFIILYQEFTSVSDDPIAGNNAIYVFENKIKLDKLIINQHPELVRVLCEEFWDYTEI